MLDLAERHSFQLGYRWSPTKYAVLNGPTEGSLTLYDEAFPVVGLFPYLGLSYRIDGICAPGLIRTRTLGTMLARSALQAIGASRSGFSLLLSARLHAQFIRPKFEYGLPSPCSRRKTLQS
jgi:hypothetical protein